MRKICLLLFFIFIMSVADASAATIKLDKDTEMHPQGWMVGALMFKNGTDVTLNERGEVISGTLKYNENLRIGGLIVGRMIPRVVTMATSDLVNFKNSSIVIFNEQGKVIAGTLAEDTIICNYCSDVAFEGGTYIKINSDGSVAQGTLKNDVYLRPVGWENNIKGNAGFTKYKAGTEITFNDKGEVIASK